MVNIFINGNVSIDFFHNESRWQWQSPYGIFLQINVWISVALLSVETIFGNAMVIAAYKLEKSISKQISNRYIVSLAISDLIIGIEGYPLFTLYVLNGDRWPLGWIACETWLFLDYTLCLVSILTVLLITADRYLSVCHTASYIKWQSPSKAQITIICSWLIPALIFGFMIYGWSLVSSTPTRFVNGECTAPFLTNPYVNMSMYVVYYWTTLIAMLILYKGIHKVTKKLEKRAGAREQRQLALLFSQRLGTQVGVKLLLSQSYNGNDDTAVENVRIVENAATDRDYCTFRTDVTDDNERCEHGDADRDVLDAATSDDSTSTTTHINAAIMTKDSGIPDFTLATSLNHASEQINQNCTIRHSLYRSYANERKESLTVKGFPLNWVSQIKNQVIRNILSPKSSSSLSTSSSVEISSWKVPPVRPARLKIPTVILTRHGSVSTSDNNEYNSKQSFVTSAAFSTRRSRKISSFSNLNIKRDKVLQSIFSPFTSLQRKRKKTKAERRAHKAFRTITFIVGCFAVLWSPYYVVATVYGFCRHCIPSLLYTLTYYMCYLNSSSNPFAYALANRQFRAAFLRMLRGDFNKNS